MNDVRRDGAAARLLAGVALGGALLCDVAGAGTTGRLAGRVLDKARQPLAGANVTVPAARLGGTSDSDGRFFILNIPAGPCEVRVSLLGHQTMLVRDVLISADNTTTLDVMLEESPLEMNEVVVSAERPVVDVNLTSQLAAVSRKELETLPVQELQDVVNLQAGVVQGHFRGGRLGEVQYQVDGVTVNNAYDNTSSLRLDRSLLQEVQVISGTFDAEYGQAMSGVVNAVLRSGGERFDWDAEMFGGGYYYSDAGGLARPGPLREPASPSLRRLVPFELQPVVGVQNYQLTVSGPTKLPQTTFLATGRYYTFDDYVRGIRRFRPTDRADFALGLLRPTGDGENVPLGYSREWSGVAKLTNRSLRNVEIGYQAIFNRLNGRRAKAAFRLNPDGLSRQRTFSIVHGLDWTHTLGKTAYYDVSLRQNYFHYLDRVYDLRSCASCDSINAYDPRYDEAGVLVGHPDYELGAYFQGVEFTWFDQTTDAFVAKATFTSQAARDHHVKLGVEYTLPSIEFGTPATLVYTAVEGKPTLVRHLTDPPDYPGRLTYEPVVGAAFAQDEIEWNDLRLRAGLRFDYFDARSTVPSDLGNPANAIADQPQSVPVAATKKTSVAPRLGVSFPITRDAALFFAYGHFTQLPPLKDVFSNANYEVLGHLQAGGIDYGVLGNPDIKPERTVQYQFGYKQALTDWLGLDASAFYKDIRDLLGVEFVSTYNGAEYARLSNADFGNVIGFTLALDQRRLGWVSSTMDYTWQLAEGNSSDPRETATRASAGEDPRPRLVPLNWDQRHTFNLTLDVSPPGRFSSSAVIRVASGQPYTPALATGFGSGLEANSGRKPASVVVDLRAERPFHLGALSTTLFGRVFNLFDTRFLNGDVFDSSGSPFYSRYTAIDQVKLNDPTRFYPPRRIEVGVALHLWAGEARP
jgi:outer membrane receptor protein involved in Fe transport